MYIDSTFPPPDHRLAQVMRVFEALDRDTLAAVIERGIDRLDTLDGDSDLEDGHDAEQMTALDSFMASHRLCGTATDDHEPDDDSHGDRAWIEWHGRTRAVKRWLHEPTGSVSGSEDDEPDDDDSCSAGDDQLVGNRVLGFGDQGEDIDREAAWPERERQPDYMGGGLSGDMSEDAEPWCVAAFDLAQAPANDA